MRWFRRNGQSKPPTAEDEQQQARRQLVERLAERHRQQGTGVIELLQQVSAECGYLPREVLAPLAETIDVPLSQLYSLATFYHAFRLSAPGRHRMSVCTGTACHVRGAPLILDALARELGVEPGQTTPDGRLTLDTVNCVGLCGASPVVVADEEYLGQMTATKAVKAIKDL